MKVSKPTIVGIVFGVSHLLIVGMPFILASGRGEGLMYIILVDLPLFWLADTFMPGPLYSSATFNFILFVIGGSFMYALVGYWGTRLVSRLLK